MSGAAPRLRAALVLLATLPSVAAATDDDPDWPEYARFLQRFRPHADERRRLNSHSAARFATFKANLRRLEVQRVRDPGASYGINMFTDLTPAEFESTYVSGVRHWNESVARRRAAGETGITPGLHSNATYRRQLSGGTVDWRYHMGGKISNVKNQGVRQPCLTAPPAWPGVSHPSLIRVSVSSAGLRLVLGVRGRTAARERSRNSQRACGRAECAADHQLHIRGRPRWM